MRALALALLAACSGAAPTPGHVVGVHPLPSESIEDRFIVSPKLASGQTLRFFTDTGGGLFLVKSKATELGLVTRPAEIDGHKGETAELGPGVDGFPMPASISLSAEATPWDLAVDGMLGQAWFAGHIWSFNYPARKLGLRDALPPHDPEHEVALGFAEESGVRQANFPRIVIEVDGQKLDVLFDTGATVKLTPEALAAMNDGHAGERATSFIVKTIFDDWHARHPDWRVVENADANARGAPMILVPVVKVAGYQAKDVWFTRRGDANFHEYMSSFMDKKIEGALGGSGLRGFRVSVDYPKAIAVFEQP